MRFGVDRGSDRGYSALVNARKPNRSKRMFNVLMVLMAVVWLIIWYFARFDYDDCLGALRQIGNPSAALYQSTQIECESAERVLNIVLTYCLATFAFLELILWWMSRRSN